MIILKTGVKDLGLFECAPTDAIQHCIDKGLIDVGDEIIIEELRGAINPKNPLVNKYNVVATDNYKSYCNGSYSMVSTITVSSIITTDEQKAVQLFKNMDASEKEAIRKYIESTK